MAKDKVEVEVLANTKSSISSLSKLGVALGAATAAVAGLIRIGKDLVDAYGEQEKAEKKLDAAIMATGKTAEINSSKLRDLAAGLQSVTVYGDEATISALAMLQQLGNLSQDGLERVIPGVLDFAAAMGVDLETAASLVGKTLGSTTNALSRYGIEVDQALGPEEELVALTAELTQKFGGMAQELANTTLGRMQQFKNMIGDLKEVGGKAISEWLSPTLEILTHWGTQLVNVIKGTDRYDKEQGDLADTTSLLADETERLAEATARVEEARQKETGGLVGYLKDIMAITEESRDLNEMISSLTTGVKYAEALGVEISDTWRAAATLFAMDVLENYDEMLANGELPKAMQRLEAFRNVLRDVVHVPPEELGVLQEYINVIWGMGDALEQAKVLAAKAELAEAKRSLKMRKDAVDDANTVVRTTGVMTDAWEDYQDALWLAMYEAGLIGVRYQAQVETQAEVVETSMSRETAAIYGLIAAHRQMEAVFAGAPDMGDKMPVSGNKELGKHLTSTYDLVDAYVLYNITLREAMELEQEYNAIQQANFEDEAQRQLELIDLEKQKQEATENAAKAVAQRFYAIGVAIAENESAIVAFGDAMKGVVSDVLIMLAKELAVRSVAAFLTGNVIAGAGYAGAAALAATSAGVVSAMAEGGIVTKPTVALIGEAGPEAVVPLGRSGVTGDTYYVAGNVFVDDEFDRRVIRAQRYAGRGY